MWIKPHLMDDIVIRGRIGFYIPDANIWIKKNDEAWEFTLDEAELIFWNKIPTVTFVDNILSKVSELEKSIKSKSNDIILRDMIDDIDVMRFLGFYQWSYLLRGKYGIFSGYKALSLDNSGSCTVINAKRGVKYKIRLLIDVN